MGHLPSVGVVSTKAGAERAGIATAAAEVASVSMPVASLRLHYMDVAHFRYLVFCSVAEA